MTWYPYQDPDRWDLVYAYAAGGTGDKIETPPTALSAGTTSYLTVSEWDGLAGTFDLKISFPSLP